ncbi:hypothetical protein ACH41H_07115 [Streptomyces sp. NPDC020800]|uniref:hypothetical protein n=1 Tax=Streptomyces sp. NPDC020800 TaxID=3365092 RepID=UPI00378A81B0
MESIKKLIELIRNLIKYIKVRLQGSVRTHVSSERVCAICEVILVIAWFYDHRG